MFALLFRLPSSYRAAQEKIVYLPQRTVEPMEDLKEVKYFLQLYSLPFFHWTIYEDSMLRIAQ